MAALIAYWSLVTTPPSVTVVGSTVAGSPLNRQTLGPDLPPAAQRHALAYAMFGLALAYALVDSRRSTVRKAMLVFTVATGYGALMEVGQWFHPDRVAALADVAVNACGAATSLTWYGLERRVRFVRLPVDGTGD